MMGALSSVVLLGAFLPLTPYCQMRLVTPSKVNNSVNLCSRAHHCDRTRWSMLPSCTGDATGRHPRSCRDRQ
jgi:hypothetical protein